MKKLNSMRVLNRSIFIFLMTIGFSMLVSIDANAQSVSDIDSRITHYTTLQSTLTQNSAKWINVQAVITHLQNVKTGLIANPNYVEDLDPGSLSPSNPVFLGVHPTVLKNYTSVQLNTFRSKVTQMEASGDVSSKAYQKLKAIVDANAF